MFLNVINYTPYTLVLPNGDTLAPMAVRPKVTHQVPEYNGMFLATTLKGGVGNLPEPSEHHVYIVEKDILLESLGRRDLYTPDYVSNEPWERTREVFGFYRHPHPSDYLTGSVTNYE